MRIGSVVLALPWLMWGAGLVGATLPWSADRDPRELRLVPTGRVGDRALVVFAEPREAMALIRVAC